MKRIAFWLLLALSLHANVGYSKGRINAKEKYRQASFERYLKRNLPKFKAVLDSFETYRTQIYFSQIHRSTTGTVSFTDYIFKKQFLYSYPASCCKLPEIVATLQHLQRSNEQINNPISQLHTSDLLHIDTSMYCGFNSQSEIKNDWTLDAYIKRMLLVSDNTCFNPIYDFNAGQNLPALEKMRAVQRFNYSCTSDLNNIGFPYQLYDTLGNVKEKKNARLIYTEVPFLDSTWANAGQRYLDANDQLIERPKSFAHSNYISLGNLHQLMKRIVSGDSLYIDSTARMYLLNYMGMWPSESKNLIFDSQEYPDNWGKYLLFGNDSLFQTPKKIRSFNKVGQAYGFLTDCAYIVDFKTQTEFILSASVFVDRDGTLNDGKYAYKTIGFPFLASLGKVLLKHEQKIKKKRNFTRLQLPFKPLK